MRILDRIRQAIREQQYRVSSHANEEMSDDNLEARDIENVILRSCQEITFRLYSTAGQASSGTRQPNRKVIVCQVLTGQVVRRFTRDPRGARYEIVGKAVDERQACVVCRFLLSGVLLIITAYREEDENDGESKTGSM